VRSGISLRIKYNMILESESGAAAGSSSRKVKAESFSCGHPDLGQKTPTGPLSKRRATKVKVLPGMDTSHTFTALVFTVSVGEWSVAQ